MKIPGFNAEASLYQTRGHYRLKSEWISGAKELGVRAQITLSCPHKGCGRCVPDPTSSLGGAEMLLSSSVRPGIRLRSGG